MAKWLCINGCGACCFLAPEERPELDTYLTSKELEQYLSMVGDDGWCINFNHENRKCNIYDTRPNFCRVKPDIFEKMYGVSAEDFNDFSIDCCHEQIESVYGKKSDEMKNYRQQVT